MTYDEPSNTWVKITPQGRGQFVESVNPDVVLRQLEEEANQKNYFEDIADKTLQNLSLTTQAIHKKVARAVKQAPFLSENQKRDILYNNSK